MSIVSRGVALACLLSGGAAGATVRGPFTLDPVRAVAANGAAIAAIVTTPAGPQVLLLARERPGDPVASVGRWPRARPDASPDEQRARAQRSRARSDLDDTLWVYDLSDSDRDAWFMEDLLTQEGLDEASDDKLDHRDRETRRAHVTRPPVPRALAASPADLWIATSRGVWRLEGHGLSARWRPSGLEGRDVSQLDVTTDSAGAVVLTARAGGTSWRSTDRGDSWNADTGAAVRAPPATQGGPARRPRRLAADVTATAVAGDEVWIGSRYGLYAADVEDDLDTWGAAGLLKKSTGVELSLLEDERPADSWRASWRRWIPRVAVAVATSVRGGRSELRALVWITVPLRRAVP